MCEKGEKEAPSQEIIRFGLSMEKAVTEAIQAWKKLYPGVINKSQIEDFVEQYLSPLSLDDLLVVADEIIPSQRHLWVDKRKALWDFIHILKTNTNTHVPMGQYFASTSMEPTMVAVRRLRGKSRQAEMDVPTGLHRPWQDMGDEGDIFHTDALPQTGHDTALDDDQQCTKQASLIVKAVADVTRKSGLAPIARRLQLIASTLGKMAAQIGIHQPGAGHNPDHSTEPLEQESEGGRALDEAQEGYTIPFYGFTAPDREEVGPTPRASLKRKADVLPEYRRRVEEGLDKLTEPIYEESEEEFHHLRDELEDLESVSSAVQPILPPISNVSTACDNTSRPPGTTPPGKDDEEIGQHDTISSVEYAAKRRERNPISVGKKRTTVKLSTKISPWRVFVTTLKRVASNGGRWGYGDWETRTEDFGRAIDLQVNTNSEDGAPLIASTVTFSLVKENPRDRTATLEVNDGAISNESREVTLDSRQASRFALDWSKKVEGLAKSLLG